MKRWLVIVGLFWVTSHSCFGLEGSLSPEGYWKSVSDVKGELGKVTAVWKLSLDTQGLLQGTIVWAPQSNPNDLYVCKKPEFNNLPYRGTLWMKGLKLQSDHFWKGGTIVDVGNSKGDIYGCEIRVVKNGKQLTMRGYILGLGVFGRTQTWIAISQDEVMALGS